MSSIAAETLIAVMKQAVADGLNEAAETAQKAARELAPKDTEGLADSISVEEATPRQATPSSRVYTNARHSVPQHERLDYEHPNGGQAKYLELAVADVDLEGILGEHVKRAFG